jgi:hypothetical protein
MMTDGTIVSYDADKRTGIILGHDGKKYQFDKRDWRMLKKSPQEGLTVNFSVAGAVAFAIASSVKNPPERHLKRVLRFGRGLSASGSRRAKARRTTSGVGGS